LKYPCSGHEFPFLSHFNWLFVKWAANLLLWAAKLFFWAATFLFFCAAKVGSRNYFFGQQELFF
jgi:hypothetical protein